MISIRKVVGVTVIVAMAGCSGVKPLVIPSPRLKVSEAATVSPDSPSETARPGTPGASGDVTRSAEDVVSAQIVQRLTTPARPTISISDNDLSTRFSDKDKIRFSADNLPVVELINYVFGDLLKVTFVVAAELPNRESKITLNSPNPISSREIYRLTAAALDDLGITIVKRDDALFVGPKSGRTGANLPIGYGSSPSDVPQAPGSVLQIIPLRYGENASISRIATTLDGIQINFDNKQNALFVTGPRPSVLRLLDVIRLLDQPNVSSSNLGLIPLTYVDAKTFTTQMTGLLGAEGVPIGIGQGINFVALENLGFVVVFASSSELLQRVEFWAAQIDRPSQGPAQQYFVYQPKFARAIDLGDSLRALFGGDSTANSAGTLARDTRSAVGTEITQNNALRREGATSIGRGSTARSGAGNAIEAEGLKIAIDERSNSLIFQTTGLKYEALLPTIRRLDTAPKQVVLEAMVAEVTLTGEFSQGVEFALSGRDGKWSGAAEPGLPGGGGLALSYISGITERARVRLVSGDNRVNILSNPVLVVRDGIGATISVGNDVPTVGATASDPLQSGRQLTTVLYRKTGLTLNIRPTVNAQGTILLEINQDISSTVPGSSGVEGAPIFFQRSVQTEVVARSGQSVFLAGLISESSSNNRQKIPGISDIPILGSLLSSKSRRTEKTELVLLITPTVIDSNDQWGAVLEAVDKGMSQIRLPK